MRDFMTQKEKERIDAKVLNEALNSFQGEEFDMLDFILTKAMFRVAILEKEGYTLEQYQNV